MRNFALLLISLPVFGGISYTCDATVDAAAAGTCSYLNSVVAGEYSSTFSNVNASIYIQMGVTGLGESTTGFLNNVTYSSYLSGLTANSLASGNAVQISAVNALNSLDTPAYGGGDVQLTSALAAALGITTVDGGGSVLGTTSGGASCTTPGSGGCYNGIITITTVANLMSATGQGLYWNQQGGPQPANDYDFYSVVEHETDEVLGTSSCMDTTGTITDGCGGTTPSAVDLFRYNGSGTLALNSACIGVGLTPTVACPTGAYFSYNGGASNGANGSIYNTLANGNDYADFVANACPGGPFSVQDGTACPGTSPMLNDDGGAEVNILNAVGFELVTVPEPSTVALLGLSLAALAVARKRLA